jgi:hypothetical protein
MTLSAVVPTEATALDPPTLLAFVLMTAPTTASSDGQPYVTAQHTQVGSGIGPSEQEVTATATDNYMGLRLMVGAAAAPDQNLDVELKRRSDNALIAVYVIPPEAITPDGSLQPVAAIPDAGDFVLTNGVQYYLDFSSSSVQAWDIGLLPARALTGGVLYEEPTFNGGIDRADPIEGAAYTASPQAPADFMFLLDLAIDGPSTFAVSGSPLQAAYPDPDCDWVPTSCCTMQQIPTMRIHWHKTHLNTNFAYYRIQRLRPGVEPAFATDADYQDVAIITDETVDDFFDVEARIGVWETYRMRVYTVLGSFSDWTDHQTNLIPVSGCGGLTFTTNQAVDLSVGYADVNDGSGPQRAYSFPEADETTYANIYGRDYTVAFRGASQRGVAFSRDLLLAALATPREGIGPAAADPLRALARAPASYVCVRDEDGNRWFGHIDVPDLDVHQPKKLHRATLTFMQTTGTPAVTDSRVC